MRRPAGITPDQEYALALQHEGPADLARETAAQQAQTRRIEARTARVVRIIGQDNAVMAEWLRRYPMEESR